MGLKNKWRVYLQPFDDFGNYTGTWTEVTDYCDMESLGSIDRALDNTDYNIGIYRNANLTLTMRNDDGKFSDVGQPTSMFKWTRSNSLVKITWTGEEYADTNGLVCGFFPAGNAWLMTETEVFRGFLSDKALSMNLGDQELAFTVLGLEEVLTAVSVPFSSILATITNTTTITIASPAQVSNVLFGAIVGSPFRLFTTGALPTGFSVNTTYYANEAGSPGTHLTAYTSYDDAFNAINPVGTSGSQSGTQSLAFLSDGTATLCSNLIYSILNQSTITKVLTVNLANIVPGNDLVLEDISPMEGKTVWDALQDILLLSNSVLYVSGSTIYVAPRTVSATLKYTFYGQGSPLGIENVQTIENIVSGIARTFNYFTCKSALSNGAPIIDQNAASVTKYGLLKKELSADYMITDAFKQTVMTNLLNEFGLPKQEFDLYTPITVDTIALTLLDKIAIDYPVVNTPVPGQQVPICGQAVCGESYLPSYSNFSFVESLSNYYKIEGVSIDPQTDLICFSVRKV